MLEVFRFECRYQLRSPLFLILSAAFFLLAFTLTASEQVSFGGVGNNLNFNAAWIIVFTQFFFSMIGMLAAVAIVAQAITRDYELKTAEMLFATGIGEARFLLGRFLAGFVFAALIGVAAIIGTLLGTFAPWLDSERIGEFAIAPYVYALLVITIPNFFLSSALFFTAAALTRSMIAAFAAAVAFLVLNVVVGNIVDPERLTLLAMIDPFGMSAFLDESRYWTIFERNTSLVPIEGNLLINRILWVGIGVAALVFTAFRYGFNLNPSPFIRKKKTKENVEPPAVVELPDPAVQPSYFAQFLSQVKTDVAGVYKTVPFYIVLKLALLNVWGGFQFTSFAFGIDLQPTTGAMLRAITGAYSFFILMIVVFYAGELVYRERTNRVADFMDAMPFPNGVMIASKIVSLWFVIFALLTVAMVAAIVNQLANGYTNLELGLYFTGLYFIIGGFFYLLAVLAVFIQVACGNRWVGMVVLIVVFFGFSSLDSFGLQHVLYSFGPPWGQTPHSDMNGYGHYMAPYASLAAYWALFCVVLAWLAHLGFPRGSDTAFTSRMSAAKTRLATGSVTVAALAMVGFAATGGWIFYNTNVLNRYFVTDDLEVVRADYERTYKQYELMDHLEAVSVSSFVDLYPYERRLESRGTFVLENTSGNPVTELFISTHARLQVNELAVDGGELSSHDPLVGVHMFRFSEPVPPGGQVNLAFDLTWDHDGFENKNANATLGSYNRVVANGTFVNNTEIMPTIGYNAGLELTDPQQRRDQNLESLVRLPKLGDPDWINRSQLGLSRRTAFRTVFSTAGDQIAVAPGYLVGDVEEVDGRRVYTYEMDEPIWPFFSFSSARYEVARGQWNDVAIEVYHHPEHAANVESMIRGTQRSLEYFSREFSPYQYRQFRILEFPRYASFAQAFPNTIPYSEAIGFVADLTDEDAIDGVFYVTAHEAAHQWWGHQVAGAQMQGMTVIVETLAQYSALMVMEHEYGKEKMRRFLKYELDTYLQQRGGEQIEELPLMYSENQAYIHYRKGSLVMYALKDLIGEANVNRALRNFLAKWAFGTGPFPTTRNLVDEFRAVAPEEIQDEITDFFEKITLYDFAVDEVSAEEVDEGWLVTFNTKATKFYADGEGRETEVPMDALIDIAVFGEPSEDIEEDQLPVPLVIERRQVTGDGAYSFTVAEKPHRVGIDPYNKRIDRNPEDNLKRI